MLFDLEFVAENTEGFVDQIAFLVREKVQPFQVQTVNVDHIVQMMFDPEFKQVAINAKFITADGMPIVVMSRLFGKKISRITGADLTLLLCKLSKELQIKLFFLGAAPAVLDKAVERAISLYNAQVVGSYSPSHSEVADAQYDERICQMINDSGANVLLVAFGAPKQEKWIARNLSRLSTKMNMGVGASLDFIAGTQRRAPVLLQKIGLEWLFRLITDPKRLAKRYLVRDSLFILIVFKELLKSIRS